MKKCVPSGAHYSGRAGRKGKEMEGVARKTAEVVTQSPIHVHMKISREPWLFPGSGWIVHPVAGALGRVCRVCVGGRKARKSMVVKYHPFLWQQNFEGVGNINSVVIKGWSLVDLTLRCVRR